MTAGFGVSWVVRAPGRADGLVGRISLGLDPGRLEHAAAKLLESHPLVFTGTQQLALQMRHGSTDPWYESCHQEKDIAPESEYSHVIPELLGGYFDEVLTRFPFPVFRARLLALTSRHCYSVHRDETPRVHVAVRTSEHAAFIFVERNEVFRVPADGDAYLLDTTEVHTAMNGGREPRLHLVVGFPWPGPSHPSGDTSDRFDG